jgi:hypothetical protein
MLNSSVFFLEKAPAAIRNHYSKIKYLDILLVEKMRD